VRSVRYRSDMAVWDRVAAAVTHRRSWAIALLIAVGAGVFIALAGPNTGADKPPLQCHRLPNQQGLQHYCELSPAKVSSP
jgi:hypothetical protein